MFEMFRVPVKQTKFFRNSKMNFKEIKMKQHKIDLLIIIII